MNKKINLLDLMSSEERQQAITAYQRRVAGDTNYRKGLKISPMVYLAAELGYYFGWEAIRDFKRGYVEDFDKSTGKRRKIPLTMEEVNLLVEGARKVWYSHVIDDARATQAASASVMSKHPAETFKKSLKPYADRLEL